MENITEELRAKVINLGKILEEKNANEREKKKLMLLEEGIALLAEDKAMKERINLEEARKPRFLFDAEQAKEKGLVAESVTQDKIYKGHWIDQKALNKKVDLIRLNDLGDNISLINEIMKDGMKIYG